MKRFSRVLCAAALAGWARLSAAAPLPEPSYGLPKDISLDGHHIDWLIHFTMICTAVVTVLVVIWMGYALARHGKDHPAVYDHGTSWGSALWTLVPVGVICLIVDGTLFSKSVTDLNARFWNYTDAEANPQAVRIEIDAHQWAWAARYPGPDGKFNTEDDVVTLNDVRIPTDAPIILQITSTDVLHSFNLPNLRVKQDAVPGSTTRLLFQAQQTGEYEIGCAQHCGPNHYKMRGVLTVLAPQAYRDWLATASADGRRGYDPEDKEAHWGWEWRRSF